MRRDTPTYTMHEVFVKISMLTLYFLGKTTIGERTSILENASITNAIIGNKVSVGPRSVLNSCKVADNAYIGAGAVIEEGAEVASLTWVAAGARVLPDAKLVGGGIYAGCPAVRVRELTSEEVAFMAESSDLAAEVKVFQQSIFLKNAFSISP